MTWGHHPRSLNWARLRVKLAGYRLVRELGRASGITAFLTWTLDRLKVVR